MDRAITTFLQSIEWANVESRNEGTLQLGILLERSVFPDDTSLLSTLRKDFRNIRLNDQEQKEIIDYLLTIYRSQSLYNFAGIFWVISKASRQAGLEPLIDFAVENLEQCNVDVQVEALFALDKLMGTRLNAVIKARENTIKVLLQKIIDQHRLEPSEIAASVLDKLSEMQK